SYQNFSFLQCWYGNFFQPEYVIGQANFVKYNCFHLFIIVSFSTAKVSSFTHLHFVLFDNYCVICDNMHFVIYLPKGFYAVTAATVAETLQAVNEQGNAKKITYEFVSGNKLAESKSGIFFNARTRPTKNIDI